MNDPELAMKVGDGISFSILVGYFVGALPTIALLLTILYTAIRLWETKTVVGWRKALVALLKGCF